VFTGSAAQSYVHDSQVVTYHTGPYAGKEIAFCYCGQNGLRIVDVTNKANMFIRSEVADRCLNDSQNPGAFCTTNADCHFCVNGTNPGTACPLGTECTGVGGTCDTNGTCAYPYLGYCHQGWLTDDRRYLFMDDESDEASFGLAARTLVINVEDLDNPFLAYTYTNDKCHVDHDLIVDGPLVYKASYSRGLNVDDAMDPLAAHEVAFFDTHPEGNETNFNGVWGVYSGFASGVVLATDRSRGLFVLNYDCNRNRIDDTDDIASLTSNDCNGNGFPDECERNDPCAPAPPTLGNDTCVGGGNDGQPCAQHSGCPGGFCRLKNRFITASIPPTATSNGLKVNLVSLDADSVATPGDYDGTDRWVGAPTIGVPDGVSGVFNAGQIQCTFVAVDWSAVGQLHIYGDVIVPTSTYDVSSCNPQATCSTNLRIATARFGDVIVPTPAVNFQDVQSIVAKFQGTPAGPSKTRSDLVGAVLLPNNPINFQDVSANVSAFQSKAFKSVVTAPPATCP